MCFLSREAAVDDLYFEDLEVGYSEESAEVFVDREEMIEYALRNDPYPIHVDEAAARASQFGELIASFGYVVSMFFRAVHSLQLDQAVQAAFVGAVEWRVRFRKAVRANDRLRTRLTITAKRLTSTGDRGVLEMRYDLVNQNDEVVIIIDGVSLILTRRPPSQAST
jgi:acyl dehydratase